MKKRKREIIVGHANTIHDPAIAYNEGDCFYAEGIERHVQCKRALEHMRLWYSWRAIKNVLKELGLWPINNANIMSVSSWNTDILKSQVKGIKFRDKPEEFSVLALMVSALELEPLYVKQLSWILKDSPPKFEQFPFIEAQELVPEHYNLNVSTKMLEHHLAHAANAVYTSPFRECIVMVLDGYGEKAHSTFYHFKNNKFHMLNELGGYSLGDFYLFCTSICGFNPWEGEEWKTMGLAAYGKHRAKIFSFFRERIRVDGLDYSIDINEKDVVNLLLPLIGGVRHSDDPDIMRMADFAFSVQEIFEKTVIQLARNAANLGLSKNLAYAGGCALNSVANGQLIGNTGFKTLHVPSAPADDGNSLGTVLYEKYCVRRKKRKPEIMSPYLGSWNDITRLKQILKFKGIKFKRIKNEKELCKTVAELIAQDHIVGWVQGRAEFGPRALGNRSILADPRSRGIKDKINRRIKFRERFRPLAPSILHEFGNEYFENYQYSPYMERTLIYRSAAMKKVPGVVHQNRTGRPHSVKHDSNSLFYKLIKAFLEETGVPILLNTSFNVMGKPIMHSVEDAITLFFTTGLDFLVIERFILSKPS